MLTLFLGVCLLLRGFLPGPAGCRLEECLEEVARLLPIQGGLRGRQKGRGAGVPSSPQKQTRAVFETRFS